MIYLVSKIAKFKISPNHHLVAQVAPFDKQSLKTETSHSHIQIDIRMQNTHI